jgi:hypothetical protein
LHFGVDHRFKVDEKFMSLPGPGNYNEQNKWNKRTYNLKFLNFQAHALNQTAAGGTIQNSPRNFNMSNNTGQSLDPTMAGTTI